MGCCYLFASEKQILPIWLKAQRDLLPVVTDKTRDDYSFSLAWNPYGSDYYRFPLLKEPHCLKYILTAPAHQSDFISIVPASLYL